MERKKSTTILLILIELPSCFLLCTPEPNSPDQNCLGIERYRYSTRTCRLTNDVIDGGYTEWTAWDDCSSNCNGVTSRSRTCNNPTPCNGGKNCDELGTSSAKKDCGPVSGQWGDWTRWRKCIKDSGSQQYGTGTHKRTRKCDSPTAQCGGEDCVGLSDETGNCRVVPPCLTNLMFSDKFLRLDNPMSIYTSAQVDIYLRTKNKCDTKTLVTTWWELYKISDGTETRVVDKKFNIKFSFNPGENEIGLYRLYAMIGYDGMTHWMEESMYVNIVHPPPHAFIEGGNGRTIGEGVVLFNARSVSYSLLNGLGDPSGLVFNWECFNFYTKHIYNLLEFKIEPAMVFKDQGFSSLKWYHTKILSDISNHLTYNSLYSKVQSLSHYKDSCSTANEIYVTLDDKDIKRAPLSYFYDITYMIELFSKRISIRDTKDIKQYDEPQNSVNELEDLLKDFDETNAVTETETFLERFSESNLLLSTIYKLNGLVGLPPSADQTFFENLQKTLEQFGNITMKMNSFLSILKTIEPIQEEITYATKLTKFIGLDNFFRMCVDSSKKNLIFYIGELFDLMSSLTTLTRSNSYDTRPLKETEKFYFTWMEDELFGTFSCHGFNGTDQGTAEMRVHSDNVTDGVGYLVYLKVEYFSSFSYFIQHAQTVTGNPLQINLECRFNCMKKTAVTSLMSLKGVCQSCSSSELNGIQISWSMKWFNLNTRTVNNISNWQSWVLSEQGTTKFVLSPNVLEQNTGYLIEVSMQLMKGQKMSSSIWLVETNMLPYGGSCDVSDDDAYWGEKKIETNGWKDEGFRYSKDDVEDVKEQLTYKIVQQTADGTDVFLYFGTEEENTITLKPGSEENNYQVTLKIEVYDIFQDFAECYINVGQILPNYTSDLRSISSFLSSSSTNMDYYSRTGDIKQVAVNAEVAASPVEPLSKSTIFDLNPSDWPSLGIKFQNGTTIIQTFDDIYNEIINDEQDEVSMHIMEELTKISGLLQSVSDLLNGTSTNEIDQIAFSLGTVISNKHYLDNDALSHAIDASTVLVEKLVNIANNESYPKYENYMTTSQDVLRILNNALESLLPKSSPDLPEALDIYTIMSDISARSVYLDSSDADLTPGEKAFLALQVSLKNELDFYLETDFVRLMVTILTNNINTLGETLHMLTYRKQLSVAIENGNMKSTGDKRYMFELYQQGYSTDEVGIQFVKNDVSSIEEQNIQVTQYNHTPFSWSPEANYITSKTIAVSVGENDIKNSTLPSNFSLVNPAYNMTYSKVVSLVFPTSSSTSQMILYRTYWKAPVDSLIVRIRNAFSTVKHVVYIRKNQPATEELFDWTKTIEQSDWTTSSEIKFIVNSGLYSQPTNIYISVLVKSEKGNTTESIEFNIVEYEITTALTGCRIWNENSQKWDSKSCELSGSTDINRTVCHCINPPGNTFASTFYVPPNSIDFKTVFAKFDLKNNAAVFATVICLVSMYFLICIWAYRQDKRDKSLWALSFLSDNTPGNTYLYIITVYTGLQLNAGTESNVNFMIISGKHSERKDQTLQEIRSLDDGVNKGFGTGSIRRFVMSTEKKIEDPSVITIWHDNSGRGNNASWFLNKIVLYDIQTKERFLFICDQWLSVDKEESSIETVVPVADKSDQNKFGFLFNENATEHSVDSHLWLSVLIRPVETNFSRLERLACCLAIMFLTMISNAMFYQQDGAQSIRIGPISFNSASLYISFMSAIMSALPIFIISFLFKKSRHRGSKYSNQNKNKYTVNEEFGDQSGFSLPYIFRIMAWVVVTFSICIPGFFLILYSMEWGKAKSEEWLFCFFLSFMESIIFVDPIKILVISILLSLLVTSERKEQFSYDKDHLIAEINKKSSTPVMFVIDAYRKNANVPIPSRKIAKMKVKRQNQLQMQKTLVEMLLYLIFLGILYLVSYSNRDPRWYQIKNHMEQQLVKVTNVSSVSSTLKLEQVNTVSSFYAWANDTLVPFMFPSHLANNKRMRAHARLFVQDQLYLRVGPMRIRQIRKLKGICQRAFADNNICYDETLLDTSKYCVGWSSYPCQVGQDFHNLTSGAWLSNDSICQSILPNCGYIAEFNVNSRISRLILNDLQKYHWITRQTKTIYIEFTLYNSDNNVFVYVTCVFEFRETGEINSIASFKPLRPYQHVGSTGTVIFLCEIAAVIGIVIFTLTKSKTLYQSKGKLCSTVWNVLDIVIIVMFYACSVIYIIRYVQTESIMSKFTEDMNRFLYFGLLVDLDDAFQTLLSIIIFLTTFRVMKVLEYSERINQLGRLLRYISFELLGCFIVFLIVFMGFLMYGFLLFGRHLRTYKTFLISSTTLINAIIGKNSIDDLFLEEPVLGRIYYFFYVLFLLWILMNMLCATLNDGISAIKQKRVKNTYGVVDVFFKFVKDRIGLGNFTTKLSYDRTKDSELLFIQDIRIENNT